MATDYREVRPGLWVRPAVLDRLHEVDLVAFDVDGVLVDVKGSFPHVIADTAQFYLSRIHRWPGDTRLIHPEETALFKQAGGFNSDWALAKAVVLFYLWKGYTFGLFELGALRAAPPSLAEITADVHRVGGGLAGLRDLLLRRTPTPEVASRILSAWDEALIERLCCEHYGGDDLCERMFGFPPIYRVGEPGLINREVPKIDPGRLEGRIGRFGLYTGRTDGETEQALILCGLAGRLLPEACITGSSPWRKPNPGGLLAIAERCRPRLGLFVGDNVDDWTTVDRYRQVRRRGMADFLFCGVLGGAPGPRAEELFRDLGVDAYAAETNLLLDHLNAR